LINRIPNNFKGISIIICCHNSAVRLPETLRHLFAQDVKLDIDWEILVINNGSTDKTANVARAEYAASKSKIPFKIIEEKQVGLNYARIAGLQHSTYEYMIWVDDDNWLQPDYINLAYQVMKENPNIGILGGIGIPVLEVEAPPWFEKYRLAYATGKQAQQTGEILNYGFLYGAGAVIRKSAWYYIIKHGFKSVLTDRKGNALSGGGDVELGNALRLAGYKLWYDEKLIFNHFIPKERLTWEYILKSTKGTGESDISAVIFYFIFRYPKLNITKLKYLYYKRLFWLMLQILKHPKSLFYYIFNRNNSNFEGIIETNRNLANLISSFKNRRLAFWAYHNITLFKENLKYL
jgi:glycosyltransferase involved in cell wall biosynthesis